MKVLLDENLPHQMRLDPPGHAVFTVAYMKWSGVGNGELLQLAADAGFDVLITNDRGLAYQQNHQTLPLAVIVILSRSNTIESLRPLLPRVLDVLKHLRPRQFVTVESD